MSKCAQHWHIAGLGAIGSLCNATAIKHGIEITPIVRENSTSYCTEFVDLSGNIIPLSKPSSIDQTGLIDNLLVPLKSYDVIPFLTKAKDKLSEQAQVVLCHNGMGTIEQALELLPAQANLYFCTSSHGVFKQGRQAHYAGAGESLWQVIRIGHENLLDNQQINSILPNAKETQDLNALLWQKLIINCAINPLTALHQVKNGELADEIYQKQVESIVDEAVRVAQACQINIQYDTMLNKVNSVIKQTAANTSSMLQDRLNNKPTEIDFITGYLLTKAKEQSIALPVNEGLLQKVRNLSPS